MSKISILIVDDHRLVRDGLASVLAGRKELEVITTLSSGEEAIQAVNEKLPDVILMDIMMRGMTGIEATLWIKQQNPSVKVILLSGEINKDWVRDGLRAGMDGYMHKDSSADSVVWAIQCVMRGERYLSKEVTDIVIHGFEEPKKGGTDLKDSADLTKRENEILRLIASGKSMREIADELFISSRTVETHKLNIQSKLNLSNTAQLVRYAIDNKLI